MPQTLAEIANTIDIDKSTVQNPIRKIFLVVASGPKKSVSRQPPCVDN
jgi:hypothetical protein